MIYKQKNPFNPTFIAVGVVIAGAVIVAVASNVPTLSKVAAGIVSTTDSNLTATGPGVAPANSSLTPQEVAVLAAIRQINSINLSNEIFSDPAFLSFTDFIRFTSQPAGRANPFAPLAGLIASSSSAGR